ncbi:MAG: hypothetical protein AABN34_06240 [Acidobacteriota bacterium]
MQTAANISLVLTDCSSLKRFADSQREISYGGFYQQLASELVRTVRKREVFRELGDKLVELAEEAHIFRDMEVVERASQILTRLQLHPQYQAVGLYYQALCIHRFGLGDIDHAARLLETVAENAPPRYRARAMISLGAKPRRQGDYGAALALYRDAGRFVSRNGIYDPFSTLQIQRMVAVVNGLKGNHRGAIALLEDLCRLAHSMRLSQPHVYYDYMNSLAVELGEVGRLEEAKNVSQIVLASPYAGAYPEWRETREEIELRGWRASRARMAFSQKRSEAKKLPPIRQKRAADDVAVSQNSFEAKNVVRLPVHEHAESLAAVETSPEGEPAHVLSMQEWTEKMHKRSSDDLQEGRPKPTTERERQARLMELRNLDAREMMMRVMTSVADDVSYDQLFRALIILEGLEPGENQGA